MTGTNAFYLPIKKDGSHQQQCSRNKMSSSAVNICARVLLILLVMSVGLATFVLVNGLQSGGREKYIGAVVEYSPLDWDNYLSPKQLILRNANRYVKIIEEASKENADIIVFPEAGLTTLNLPYARDKIEPFLTFIPDSSESAIPCDDKEMEFAEHLRLLSCAAKKNRLYVVVNMDEKVKCKSEEPGCPNDLLMFYNTNIVFDRTGTIIAKYRKYNLFLEPEFNNTALPQYTTFRTDFGVNFGMFICFDILFPEPAEKLVSKYKVTDIIYSTAWFSELPMITALQVQAGYSYTMNVNLLASGYNRPDVYNAGSGIYAGESGPVIMIMPETRTTKLLVGEVPIKSGITMQRDCDTSDSCPATKGKVIDINFEDSTPIKVSMPGDSTSLKGLVFFKEDMSKFSSKLLQEADILENSLLQPIDNEQETNFNYVNNGFNCSIKAKWVKNENSQNGGPIYRLVGYSGPRTFGRTRVVYIEVCAVVACPDESLASCGLRPTFSDPASRTNIESISISITSVTLSTPFVMTLDSNILPLNGDEVSFIESVDKFNENLQKAHMFLEKPRNNLISFGLYKQ